VDGEVEANKQRSRRLYEEVFGAATTAWPTRSSPRTLSVTGRAGRRSSHRRIKGQAHS